MAVAAVVAAVMGVVIVVLRGVGGVVRVEEKEEWGSGWEQQEEGKCSS